MSDQSAVAAAAHQGPVIPVYILDDETPKYRAMGRASRWWLHHSLTSLDRDLRDNSSQLILRRGRSEDVLAALASETGATRVHCLRHYEPWWRNAERAVARRLDLVRHDGNYLAPPGAITTRAGHLYKVYTPFWHALNAAMPPAEPHLRPREIPAPSTWPESDTLGDWRLLPSKPNWATGFAKEWTPGEPGAHRRLDQFRGHADRYVETRNFPSVEGSSRLSPHLHFGEISAVQAWHRISDSGGSADAFLGELGWRDFAQNLIVQFPDYGGKNGREAFDDLPWRTGKAAASDLRAWQHGETGYPIVDAGMRQLWASGWMHNRVRMIVASFLVKHLLIDWREGEKWFWDTLVDADYANNSVNWQWIAGTGIDSNMFVRIMAPLVQSEKFGAGGYIRRWVAELAEVPDAAIHDPDSAGCRPRGYPPKLIGHREGRERALAAATHVR